MILDNKSIKFNLNGIFVGNKFNNFLNVWILYIIYWYLIIVWFWLKKKKEKKIVEILLYVYSFCV